MIELFTYIYLIFQTIVCEPGINFGMWNRRRVLTLSLMISIIPILILTLCIKGHILYRANIVWKVDLLRSEYNLTMESNNVISQGYCMHIWCSAIRHYLAWIHLHIRTIEQEELNINYFLYMMQFYIFSNCKKWAS